MAAKDLPPHRYPQLARSRGPRQFPRGEAQDGPEPPRADTRPPSVACVGGRGSRDPHAQDAGDPTRPAVAARSANKV
jgi:hypothetical protein